MLPFTKINEEEYLFNRLVRRWIFEQYKKSKNNILLWNFSWNRIKLKKPTKDGIWYFRINKKYRALWYVEWTTLIIFDIDDHQ